MEINRPVVVAASTHCSAIPNRRCTAVIPFMVVTSSSSSSLLALFVHRRSEKRIDDPSSLQFLGFSQRDATVSEHSHGSHGGSSFIRTLTTCLCVSCRVDVPNKVFIDWNIDRLDCVSRLRVCLIFILLFYSLLLNNKSNRRHFDRGAAGIGDRTAVQIRRVEDQPRWSITAQYDTRLRHSLR